MRANLPLTIRRQAHGVVFRAPDQARVVAGRHLPRHEHGRVVGGEIFKVYVGCWESGRDGEEEGRDGEDGELHFGRFGLGFKGLRWLC
jgi:hypothetical protein